MKLTPRQQNMALAGVSALLGCALAVAGYATFRFVIKPSLPSLAFQGQRHDYELSFYNSAGQKISEPDGPLRLMLDPFAVYRMLPGTKTRSFEIDEHGFRGRYDLSKPVIIVLGGSAAFGYGLPSDSTTFAAVLQSLLGGVEVVNASVPGYLSGQELALVVHQLDRFRPLGYLLFDGWNDLTDQYLFDWVLRSSGPPDWVGTGFNHEFYTLGARLRQYHEQTSDKAMADEQALPDRPVPVRSPEYLQALFASYLANVEAIHAFAKARRGFLVACLQPELGSKRHRTGTEEQLLEVWEKNVSYLSLGIPAVYAQMGHAARAFCDGHDIPFVDLNQAAVIRDDPRTLFYDAVHPNEEGHRIIAATVLPLVKHLLDEQGRGDRE